MKAVFLSFLAVLLFPAISLAADNSSLDTSGLTQAQRAKLAAEIESMQEDPSVKFERVEQYATLGAQIGEAFAETAERLGVAANDFVQTPVGKLTVALIVYKIIGKDVIGFVVGSLFLIVGTIIWLYVFRRMCLVAYIEYDEKGKKKKISYAQTNSYNSNVHEWRAAIIGAIAVIVAISQLIMWLPK